MIETSQFARSDTIIETAHDRATLADDPVFGEADNDAETEKNGEQEYSGHHQPLNQTDHNICRGHDSASTVLESGAS